MDSNFYIPLPHRTVITVQGDDAATFLQGMLTNNITKATPSQAIYAALLTPQGKYLYDFFVLGQAEGYLLDCSQRYLQDILKKLSFYRLRAKVTIEDRSDRYEVVAALGPKALEGITELQPGNLLPHLSQDGTLAFIDPRSASLYARCFVEKNDHFMALKAQGFVEGDINSYEQLRIRHTIADGDKDLVSGDTFPLPFGLNALNAIDYTKGCYVGQEVTARTHHKGTLHKQLYTLQSHDSSLPPPGTPVTANGKKIGTLCSSSGNIGLALLDTAATEAAPSPLLQADEVVVERIMFLR